MSYFSNFSQYAPTLPNLSQYAPTLPNFSSVTSGFSDHWNALKGRISVAGQEAKEYCDRTSSSIMEKVRGVWEKFLSYFSVSDATSSLSSNWSSFRVRVSVAGQSAQEYCVSIGASVSEKVQTIRENLGSYLPVSGAYARGLQTQLYESEQRVLTLQAELLKSGTGVKPTGEDNAALLQQLAEARAQVQGFEAIRPDMESKIGEMESEITEYEFRIDKLERENAQLNEDLQQARAGLEEVRRANASLDRQPRGSFDEGVVLSPVEESGDEPVPRQPIKRSNSLVSGLKGAAKRLGLRTSSSTPRGGPLFHSDLLDVELNTRGTSQEPGANRGFFSGSRPASAPLPPRSPSIGPGQVAPEPVGKGDSKGL